MASAMSENDMLMPEQVFRFDLPGFNLPLNYGGNWYPETFNNALHAQRQHFPGDAAFSMKPFRERTMLQIMNEITDKPGWEKKVFDADIVAKWRAETVNVATGDAEMGDVGEESEASSPDETTVVTPAMMDWIISELRWRAEDFEISRMCFAYDGDVIKSDEAVPSSLKYELQQAVRGLENVADIRKDWHPGSDGKVLDLVHPSLFPLVYGRSRILTDTLISLENCKIMAGRGETLQLRPEKEMIVRDDDGTKVEGLYSRNYQWLPCDVDFQSASPDHDCDLRIASYINNLDPQQYAGLYKIIEKVLSKAIPLWDRTVSTLSYDSPKGFTRVPYYNVTYGEFDKLTDEEKAETFGEKERYPEYQENHSRWEHEQMVKHLVPPDAATFKSDGPLSGHKYFSLREEFGQRGLQVIVKLANIELTPEKPKYEGGSWHVECQLLKPVLRNEHICATALYYYDVENIDESRLSFRQIVAVDFDNVPSYEQDEHDWLLQIFGMEQDTLGSGFQDLGGVRCEEGRLVTFPNVLLHRVEPFELKDPSKPGHRKILALFLVDPHLRIISTANIPPQQLEWWWSEHVLGDPRNRITAKLPIELQEQVLSYLDDVVFPVTLDDAKRLRLDLMKERSKFDKEKMRALGERKFDLCEH